MRCSRTGQRSGGSGPTCGNGTPDPGEVCFTAPAVEYPTTVNAPITGLDIHDCDSDGDEDVAVTMSVTAGGFATMVNNGSGNIGGVVAVNTVDPATALAGGNVDAGDYGWIVGYGHAGYFDLYANNGACGASFAGAIYTTAGTGLTPFAWLSPTNPNGPCGPPRDVLVKPPEIS
mgnify:CR=1 FL=1